MTDSRIPAQLRQPRLPFTASAEQIAEWTQEHGPQVAENIALASARVEAFTRATTPANTSKTYRNSWTVWERFCRTQNYALNVGSHGVLSMYALWLMDRGREKPDTNGVVGYAPTSARTHVAAAAVNLRERGCPVDKEEVAAAFHAISKTEKEMAKAKQPRRGRGQAAAANAEGLLKAVKSCPDTLTGARDKALLLLGFAIGSRACEPAGLILDDIREEPPRGLVVDVRVTKTKSSERAALVPWANNPLLCPVQAWLDWREQLHAVDASYNVPSDPAFHAIDMWGHVGGAMSADAITRAVKRIAARGGLKHSWTGHSLRAGMATASRAAGQDDHSISRQGGWAPGSTSLERYLRADDDWKDAALNNVL